MNNARMDIRLSGTKDECDPAKELLQELFNEAIRYGKTTVGIEWMAQKYGVELKISEGE